MEEGGPSALSWSGKVQGPKMRGQSIWPRPLLVGMVPQRRGRGTLEHQWVAGLSHVQMGGPGLGELLGLGLRPQQVGPLSSDPRCLAGPEQTKGRLRSLSQVAGVVGVAQGCSVPLSAPLQFPVWVSRVLGELPGVAPA